jgi:hypothetical protein
MVFLLRNLGFGFQKRWLADLCIALVVSLLQGEVWSISLGTASIDVG